MSPSDLSTETVVVRLQLMRQLLDALDQVGSVNAQTLADDAIRRLAIERILTQLVEFAADVNQHVASTTGGAVATSYRESFDLAVKSGLITRDLADALKPSVGLRNVLVHEYVGVDLGIVAASVPVAREQYGEYVRMVAQWLAQSR